MAHLPTNCRNCPLCGGTAEALDFPYLTVWAGREFNYVRCGGCGCVFVTPIPTDSEFAAMYSRENYHDEHYADVNTNLDGKYRRSAEWLARWGGGRKSVLDFGCGNGAFILAAQRVGLTCTGIEFQASAIEGARAKTGADVDTLDGIRARGGRYDVVHLGDVFEHLPAPAETITALSELLAPGGVFFVEGPLQANPSLVYFAAKAAKRLRRAVGKDVPGASPPTHLILVDRAAQERFFTQRMGYNQLRFEVYEDGWPYRAHRSGPATVGSRVKDAVASGAIALSRLKVGGERVFGNRFAALFEAT